MTAGTNKVLVALSLALSLALCGGCLGARITDDSKFPAPDSGSTSGPCVPSDCPGAGNECLLVGCVGGQCSSTYKKTGTKCGGQGGVCKNGACSK